MKFLNKKSAETPTIPKPSAQLPQGYEYVWDGSANQWIAVQKNNPNITPPTYNPNNTNNINNSSYSTGMYKSSTIESLNQFLDGDRYKSEVKIEANLIKDGLIKYSGYDFNKGTKYSITEKGLKFLKDVAQAEFDKESYLLDGINEGKTITGPMEEQGRMNKVYSIFEKDGSELASNIKAENETDAKVKFILDNPEYKDSLTIKVVESGNYETTIEGLDYPNPSVSPSTDITLENHTGWVNTAGTELFNVRNLIQHLKNNDEVDFVEDEKEILVTGNPKLINSLEHQIKEMGLHCEAINQMDQEGFEALYTLKIYKR